MVTLGYTCGNGKGKIERKNNIFLNYPGPQTTDTEMKYLIQLQIFHYQAARNSTNLGRRLTPSSVAIPYKPLHLPSLSFVRLCIQQTFISTALYRNLGKHILYVWGLQLCLDVKLHVISTQVKGCNYKDRNTSKILWEHQGREFNMAWRGVVLAESYRSR